MEEKGKTPTCSAGSIRGMNKEGILVGTNWNAHLMGLEVEPVELAKALLEAMEDA